MDSPISYGKLLISKRLVNTWSHWMTGSKYNRMKFVYNLQSTGRRKQKIHHTVDNILALCPCCNQSDETQRHMILCEKIHLVSKLPQHSRHHAKKATVTSSNLFSAILFSSGSPTHPSIRSFPLAWILSSDTSIIQRHTTILLAWRSMNRTILDGWTYFAAAKLRVKWHLLILMIHMQPELPIGTMVQTEWTRCSKHFRN